VMGFRVLDPVERVVYKPTENEIECLRHLGKDVAMAVKKIPHLKNLNAWHLGQISVIGLKQIGCRVQPLFTISIITSITFKGLAR